MATISFQWRREQSVRTEMNASETETYLCADRTDDSIELLNGLSKEKIIDQFIANANRHNNKNHNLALEIVQSWHPKESAAHSPAFFAELGSDLAENLYPGHRYFIRTHTEKEHVHNHILIDPVHPETGKRINNTKMFVTLTKANDEVCKARGLSVLKSFNKDKSKSIPKEVLQIQKRGGESYRLALMAKSEVAGLVSTSYDQYVAVMSGLGIKVLVKPKNITYYYGDKKQVRGNKLGERYDKQHLEQLFKRNDEKFSKQPHVRASLWEKVDALRDVQRDFVGAASRLPTDPRGYKKFAKKDYSQFTNIKRTDNPGDHPSIRQLTNAFVPARELEKAKKGDVLKYAHERGYEVTTSKSGRNILKDRRHIILTKNGWYNAKSKTSGSLIEFVAYEKDISYLRAAAEITGNTRLLWLEKNLGKPVNQFKAFHLPKTTQEKRAFAIKRATHYLGQFGIGEKKVSSLFEKGKFQVSKTGVIRFFDKDYRHGYVDVDMDRPGKWKASESKKANGVFHAFESSKRSATVFETPEDYFSVFGNRIFNEKRGQNILVLMDSNEDGLETFLAGNPHIKDVKIFVSKDQRLFSKERGQLSKSNEKYHLDGIKIDSITRLDGMTKELGLEIE